MDVSGRMDPLPPGVKGHHDPSGCPPLPDRSLGPPLHLPRARNDSAPSSGNCRRPSGGQDIYPSLLGRSAPERDGALAWGAGRWNGLHGLHPDGTEITLRVPLKRAPRVGRPTASQKPRARAGCRAWARSALVEAFDQVIGPAEGFTSGLRFRRSARLDPLRFIVAKGGLGALTVRGGGTRSPSR